MEFSRQEYWSGLSFLSSEDLPNPGIKPTFPALLADSFLLNHQGSSWPHQMKHGLLLKGLIVFESSHLKKKKICVENKEKYPSPGFLHLTLNLLIKSLHFRIKHLAISISATDFSQGMNNKEDVTLTKAALP